MAPDEGPRQRKKPVIPKASALGEALKDDRPITFKSKASMCCKCATLFVSPLLVFVGVIVVILIFVAVRMYIILGTGGQPMPDTISGLAPSLSSADLQTVIELDLPPGNLAVSSSERMFFNFHPEYTHPSGTKIASCQIVSGRCVSWDRHPATERVNTVLSLRIDQQDRLWLLDFGMHATVSTPALLMYKIGKTMEEDEFVDKYEFASSVAPFGSMLNDLQISPDGEWIYIADTCLVGSLTSTCEPALVVYHVPTRKSRRLLAGHGSMLPENVLMTVHDSNGAWPQKLGPFTMRIGVDSIVLDRAGKWLLYGPVTGGKLYRIEAAALQNGDFKDKDLASMVEVFASKPISDGLTMDDEGNVFVSAFEHSAIVRINANDLSQSLIVQDKEKLRWPDGFSFGPQRWLYVTNSALHLKMGGAVMEQHAPYYIMRAQMSVGAAAGQ